MSRRFAIDQATFPQMSCKGAIRDEGERWCTSEDTILLFRGARMRPWSSPLVEVLLQWDWQRTFRYNRRRLQWGRVPYAIAEGLQMWQQRTKAFVVRPGA